MISSNLDGVSLGSAESERAVGRALQRGVIRALDLTIASVALLLSAPLLVLLWILIRLDSRGPGIFRQRRLGRGKREFTVYKFRTMRSQADPAVHREYIRQLVAGDNVSQTSQAENLYKLVADDRITSVGRRLRRSSLDELPQLFNVVLGQMSIVGPRPVLPYEAELYSADQERRFEVKPGLTGLWQVSGRNRRSYQEMLALDRQWVDRESLGLYLSILVRTPLTLIRSDHTA